MAVIGQDGTFGDFQGFPLFAVHVLRSRGWQSDVSVVEIPFEAFPESFDFTTPGPGQLAVKTSGSQTRGASTPLPRRMAWEGALSLSEVVRGEAWAVTIGPLFVVRVETVKVPVTFPDGTEGTKIVRVRVYLVDERYFWPRGVAPRWSFNRVRADGSVALDSVRPGGSLWNRFEVASDFCAHLFRKPELVVAPEEWKRDTSALELEPFPAAVEALARLTTDSGLLEPCLRLDGSVALHRPGEGRLGYVVAGSGANDGTFPPGVMLWKEGQGQGNTVELGYPEDYVIVVGGVRVVTIALDAWRPVLVVPSKIAASRVLFLTDKNVIKLTGSKRYGMEWLKRFVLQPRTLQSNVDVPQDVLDLLAAQAWRLFMLPGAMAEDDRGVYQPGPNAHMLPLVDDGDRAETTAGRRMPLKVDTFRFTTVHQALQGDAARLKLFEITSAIDEIRGRVVFDPDLPGPIDEAFRRTPIRMSDVFDPTVPRRGLSLDELQAFLSRAREIEKFRKARGGDLIAESLLDLTGEQLAAEEETGADAGRTELWEIALEVLKLEKEFEANAGKLSAGDEDFLRRQLDVPGVREAFLERIKRIMQAAEKARDDQRTASRLGAGPERAPAVGMSVMKNLPRQEDTGASLFSAELGVIRTGDLAVHVTIDPEAFRAGEAFPAVPTNASHAMIVECPVRVAFGATVRPRSDRPPGSAAPTRPQTGTPAPNPNATPVRQEGETLGAFHARRSAFEEIVRRARLPRLDAKALRPGEKVETADEFVARQAANPDCAVEPDVVSEALTDEETYYTAAFKRTARARAEKVKLADVPRDQAVRIKEPHLVELVTLSGSSNVGTLDRDAERLAAERFNVPDLVTTRKHVLARPWPVNCDGLIASVEIKSRVANGAPCGYETTITTGGDAAIPVTVSGTRERPRPSRANGGKR